MQFFFDVILSFGFLCIQKLISVYLCEIKPSNTYLVVPAFVMEQKKMLLKRFSLLSGKDKFELKLLDIHFIIFIIKREWSYTDLGKAS